MSEQEIALLYTRRQQQAVDLEARLAEAIAFARFQPVEDFGYLYAFAQPVPPRTMYWDVAVKASNGRELLQRAPDGARRAWTLTCGR